MSPEHGAIAHTTSDMGVSKPSNKGDMSMTGSSYPSMLCTAPEKSYSVVCVSIETPFRRSAAFNLSATNLVEIPYMYRYAVPVKF